MAHAEDGESFARELRLGRVKDEGDGAFLLETDRPKAVAEPNGKPSRGEKAERRVDEATGKAVGGKQRVAGLTPRRKGLAQQRGCQRRRTFWRICVQRGG